MQPCHPGSWYSRDATGLQRRPPDSPIQARPLPPHVPQPRRTARALGGRAGCGTMAPMTTSPATTSDSTGPLEHLVHVPGVCDFSRLQHILLCGWIGSTLSPGFPPYLPLLAEQARTYPKGFTVTHLVAGSMRLPDARERKTITHLSKKYQTSLRCVTYLLEGDSFWFSTMHAVASGLRILTKSAYPLQIFKTPEDLASWLVAFDEKGCPYPQVPRATLAKALWTIRARMRESNPPST